jgi:hypothetical protein
MPSQNMQAVLDNEVAYHFSGLTQATGRVSSQMLWNPAGSGKVFEINQLWIYSSITTAFNMKRRTSIFGTGGVQRNSAYFPGDGSGPVSQVIEQYSDVTATTVPSGNAVMAFDPKEVTFEYPIVFGPGEGLIIYPDTAAFLNWTLSAIIEIADKP